MCKNSRILIVFVVTCVCLAGAVSADPVITFEPATLSLQEGSSAQVTLWLDEAPLGLAGYDCSIESSSPSTIHVTSASFPAWATLNSAKETAPGLLLQATDIGRLVQNGSVQVELATVTIKAISPGTATISLSDIHFSADGGSAITPTPATLVVTVPGAETGSGSSSTPTSTPTPTTTTPTHSSSSSGGLHPTGTLTSIPTTVPAVNPSTIAASGTAIQVTTPVTMHTTSEPVTSLATSVNPTWVPTAPAGTLTAGVALGIMALALLGSGKRRDN